MQESNTSLPPKKKKEEEEEEDSDLWNWTYIRLLLRSRNVKNMLKDCSNFRVALSIKYFPLNLWIFITKCLHCIPFVLNVVIKYVHHIFV